MWIYKQTEKLIFKKMLESLFNLILTWCLLYNSLYLGHLSANFQGSSSSPNTHAYIYTHIHSVTPTHLAQAGNPVSCTHTRFSILTLFPIQLPWDCSRCMTLHLRRPLSGQALLSQGLPLFLSNREVNIGTTLFLSHLYPPCVKPHPWQGPLFLIHLTIYKTLP